MPRYFFNFEGATGVVPDLVGRELLSDHAARGEAKKIAADLAAADAIEGHTDNRPINNSQFRSNWELSSARAIGTYNFMTSVQEGLRTLPNASGTATLLGASAYADSRGVTANRTPEERKQNRRIDFRFLMAPPTDREVVAAADEVARQ